MKRLAFQLSLLALILVAGALALRKPASPGRAVASTDEPNPIRGPGASPLPSTANSNAATHPTSLSVAAPTPTVSHKVRAAFSLQEFSAELPGSWEFVANPDGTVETLSGGQSKIPLVPAEVAAASALALARQMVPHFGISPEEISAAPLPLTQTFSRTAFRFDQFHLGRLVFQGHLSLFAINASGEVSLVTNELRPIDRTEAGPTLSADRAASEFAGQAEVKPEVLQVQGPFYFVERRVATPSYLLNARSAGVSFEEQIVIDGNTGRVLYRQPLGTH